MHPAAETPIPPPAPDPIVDLFRAPPNEFRLVQYGLSRQTLETYPRYGIGGVMAFFYAQLYQGTDGAAGIGPLVDAARDQGFSVWLADDFGYPSGMAGGRIVEEEPALEVRGLTCVSALGQGQEPVSIELPETAERFLTAVVYPLINGEPDLTAGQVCPVEDRRVTAAGTGDAWRLDAFAMVVRDRDVQAQSTMAQFGHSGRFPDLMNKAAVSRFLELMHEPILAQITDAAAKVEGFYTNEPNLMQQHWTHQRAPHACQPWTPALFTAFMEMHGYDLTPRLGALFDGDGLDARRTRMHFQQTVAELLTAAFARQIAEWCAARGIASSGHFLLNEYLAAHVACYGDLMKFASEFHVPALDIGIPNPDRFDTFPYQQTRFFSSIASWKQRDRVILLLDPIIGGGGLRRLSPALPLLHNSANMAFFHGANLLTSYLPLNRRPDGSAAGYTPEEFGAFNEYIARIALLLRGARRETSVALYYPIAMFQADYRPGVTHWPPVMAAHKDRQEDWDRVERALLDADIDYCIVHPEAVAEARVEGGEMRIGYGRFRYLVMPRVEFLPLAVLERIRTFEAGGGTVIWVDTRPEAGVYAREDATVAKALADAVIMGADELPSRIGRSYGTDFDLSFSPGPVPMPVARFVRNDSGECVYYLVNRTGQSLEARIRGHRTRMIRVFDPATGEVLATELPAVVGIEAHNSLLIVDTGTGE